MEVFDSNEAEFPLNNLELISIDFEQTNWVRIDRNLEVQRTLIVLNK